MSMKNSNDTSWDVLFLNKFASTVKVPDSGRQRFDLVSVFTLHQFLSIRDLSSSKSCHFQGVYLNSLCLCVRYIADDGFPLQF